MCARAAISPVGSAARPSRKGRLPIRGSLRGKRGREELRRGILPGYHVLNRCELPGHQSDYLVCDFRSLFGTHVEVAKTLATGPSLRVRLLPPYREDLAQAFARFFMRVGLPVDVPPFA